MKAVVKLGLENFLVVIEDKTILEIVHLDSDNYLNDIKSQLLCHKKGSIDEIDFIVTPMVVEGNRNSFVTDGIIVGDLECDKEYTYIIDRGDLENYRKLASALAIDKINIYNKFDIFTLIGQKEPCVIVGAYFDSYYIVCVDYRGIIRFETYNNLKKDYIINMCRATNCTKAYNESNLLLKGQITQTYTNATDLSDNEFKYIYQALVLTGIKPCYATTIRGTDEPIPEEYNVLQEELTDISDDATAIYEVEDNDEDEGFTKPKSKPKKFKKKTKFKDKHSVVTAMVMVLSVIIGMTFFSNKELPAQTEDINSRAVALEENLQPYEDEKEYLTYYQNSLDTGVKTSDILEKISKIEVNGILSEIGVNKDTVGIFVYLADKDDIDKYKKSVNKIVDVESCDYKGEINSDSTGSKITLYKYLIQGKIK